MADLILESFRALVLAGIVGFLWRSGRRQLKGGRNDWGFVVAGFGLLLFGSLLDITDNFEALNRFVVVGDTEVEAFLGNFVGFLGGFVVLAWGLFRWLPRVGFLSPEIAHRQRAEDALRASEARLRAILDHAPMEIYLKDLGGRYVEINRRYEDLWGVTNAEVRGKLPGEVHDDPAFAEASRTHDLAVLRGARGGQPEQRPQDRVHVGLYRGRDAPERPAGRARGIVAQAVPQAGSGTQDTGRPRRNDGLNLP